MPSQSQVYGGVLAKLANTAASKEALERMAMAIIKAIVREAKKDFAKRGWKLDDPKGGPPLDESFTFDIIGKKTIEIRSSYWGIEELTSGNIPSRKMEWLTQEAKDKDPKSYPLTPSERKAGMKQMGRVSKGERKPLVVPIKSAGGTVLLRTAPLKTTDAWVHPGIAKYTFMERGFRKGRQEAVKEMIKYLKEQAARGGSK